MIPGASLSAMRRVSRRCLHTLKRNSVNTSQPRLGRCLSSAAATAPSSSTSSSSSSNSESSSSATTNGHQTNVDHAEVDLVSSSVLSSNSERSSSATINGHQTNVDHAEVDKFSRLAATWWDPDGEMGILHRMNPVRLKYIRDCCISHFRSRLFKEPPTNLDAVTKPLAGLRVVDVGCGGGLLTEPLARMGAEVVGIDAAQLSTVVAARHAKQDPNLDDASLTYEHCTVEDLRKAGRKFDVVCALEIVEHVPDAGEFLNAVASLVDDGGGLFVSTLNKTPKSYALAIAAAEYVLRWVPPGTHDWTRFLTPETITRELTRSGLNYHSAVGMTYNPLSCAWSLDNRDLDVNYALFATRKPAMGDVEDNGTTRSSAS